MNYSIGIWFNWFFINEVGDKMFIREFFSGVIEVGFVVGKGFGSGFFIDV